jgi:hypothetical protein
LLNLERKVVEVFFVVLAVAVLLRWSGAFRLLRHHAVELSLPVNAGAVVLVYARRGDKAPTDKRLGEVLEGLTLGEEFLDGTSVFVVASLDDAQQRAAELGLLGIVDVVELEVLVAQNGGDRLVVEAVGAQITDLAQPWLREAKSCSAR